MFNRLREKWKVSWSQFTLIFCTFAVGGTITGKCTSILMKLTGIQNLWLKIPVYIVIATPLWMAIVTLTSIPFGQFSFFKKYVGNMILRLFNNKQQP